MDNDYLKKQLHRIREIQNDLDRELTALRNELKKNYPTLDDVIRGLECSSVEKTMRIKSGGMSLPAGPTTISTEGGEKFGVGLDSHEFAAYLRAAEHISATADKFCLYCGLRETYWDKSPVCYGGVYREDLPPKERQHGKP